MAPASLKVEAGKVPRIPEGLSDMSPEQQADSLLKWAGGTIGVFGQIGGRLNRLIRWVEEEVEDGQQ